MLTLDSTPAVSAPGSRPLRLGYVALTDAAPLIVAQELGFFAAPGLRVELRREIGWASIRDKIIYGELDAAQAPAPVLWSIQLGLRCPRSDILTALVLSCHGNAITLSRALWEAGVRDAASLGAHARSRPARHLLTFAVVFPYSSHQLLLVDWLRTAGLEPERTVRIVVVPPAQMFRNLAAGTIDGFCSGEPWNSLAVREGAGWCAAWSAALQPGHVEKVLLVKKQFAESRGAEHAALVRALVQAAAWCDEPHHRERLADLLGDVRFLNLPAKVMACALTGKFDRGFGQTAEIPDFHVFHRDDASRPTLEKAAALQRALGAAGLLPPAAAANPELPRRLFREDLHREIMLNTNPHELTAPPDRRGVAPSPA